MLDSTAAKSTYRHKKTGRRSSKSATTTTTTTTTNIQQPSCTKHDSIDTGSVALEALRFGRHSPLPPVVAAIDDVPPLETTGNNHGHAAIMDEAAMLAPWMTPWFQHHHHHMMLTHHLLHHSIGSSERIEYVMRFPPMMPPLPPHKDMYAAAAAAIVNPHHPMHPIHLPFPQRQQHDDQTNPDV